MPTNDKIKENNENEASVSARQSPCAAPRRTSPRHAALPRQPAAEMFHDLIWDLGICSIESIESYNLFTSSCSNIIRFTVSTHVNYINQFFPKLT